MSSALAQLDSLIDLLVEAVVRELIVETQTSECPRTGQGNAGIHEDRRDECTPTSN